MKINDNLYEFRDVEMCVNRKDWTPRDSRMRNFSGYAAHFNDEGKRNFCFILPEEDVEEMVEDGFRVKRFKPSADDPDAIPNAFLKVTVKFDSKYPPQIVLVRDNGKVLLNEDSVGMLDDAIFENVKLSVTRWTNPQSGSIVAYLNSLWVELAPDRYVDPFADEYDDIPYSEVI